MRITAQAAQFYAGAIHFPESAPWLGELLAELFAFPGVKHDDQVDSVSQALGFIVLSQHAYEAVEKVDRCLAADRDSCSVAFPLRPIRSRWAHQVSFQRVNDFRNDDVYPEIGRDAEPIGE
jgi:hypothetical protein